MEKRVRVRFAPSPTGPLHIGGVRTALYNYLFAKGRGGDCILRIEDTDQGRYVPGAEAYIVEALGWVGIHFDEGPHISTAEGGGPHAPYRQSERKPMYRGYAEDLIAREQAYYAFDTEADLVQMRVRMEAAGVKSPQYNSVTREYMQNSLTLPADEVARRLSAGEPYVIRMKIPRGEEVRFHDEIRGWVVVHSSQVDDKVLLKSDGMPTYHMANIVDDHLMEITHVIRGEEWLPSTPLHVLLYRAFGWEPPLFAHLPLLLKPDGNGKLSKRDGDQLGFPVFPLRWQDPVSGEISSGYREAGYLPEAMVNFLALLGWNPGHDEELMTMDELISKFTLERVGKSGVKFDYQKGIWFNQHYLKLRTPESLLPQMKEQLTAQGKVVPTDDYLAKVVELLRDRVSFTHEFVTMGIYFFENPVVYDADMVRKRWNTEVAGFMEPLHNVYQDIEPWDAHTTEAAFQALAVQLGIGTGKILPGLRLVLTGMPFGPGVFEVMAMIGKKATLERLAAAKAIQQPLLTQ